MLFQILQCMGNFGLTLSLSDPVGKLLLSIFRDIGFGESNENNVFRLNDMFLFVVDPLIVPSSKYELNDTLNPYPADFDLFSTVHFCQGLTIFLFYRDSEHYFRYFSAVTESGIPSLHGRSKQCKFR